MKRTDRQRWLAIGLCVAIVAVAALAPFGAAVELAVFERAWVRLPDIARAIPARDATPRLLPNAPFIAPRSSRAPPSLSA